MRYVTILIVIVVYWFLLGIGLNYLVKDEFILSQAMEGNTSSDLLDITDVNMTSSIYDSVDISGDNLKSFPSALKIMFGFRTPIPTGIPQIIAVFLSILNWATVLFFGLALYKVISPFVS